MNPWGLAPAIKKYPLGDVQRILESSSSYKSYSSEYQNDQSIENLPKEDASSGQISRECENLLRINTEITDLNSNFAELELFLKYNNLISDESIKHRIRIVESLSKILSNISEAKIFEKSVEKQEKGASFRNFITVDYAYKKVLIQMLKLIKQNDRQLEKGKVLGLREEMDIKDLLNYFYLKGDKVDEVSNEVVDLCQNLLSKNEKLESLFAKR